MAKANSHSNCRGGRRGDCCAQIPTPGGPGRGPFSRNPIEDAVVVTVTMTLEAVDPLSVTELGEGVQVAAVGAPVQAKFTVPLNPPPGAMLSL